LIKAIYLLSKDVVCRNIIINSFFNVVRILFRLLQNFHEGGKSNALIGGGGSDISLADLIIKTLHSLLIEELERDEELCQRLISRKFASLFMSIYELKESPLEPDDDGTRSLLRLNCWITGHSGEYLPILKGPGSSLKVGSLYHGDLAEVSDKFHYKPTEENDFSKIPIHLRPKEEPPKPHYRLRSYTLF
jgi:hypothetical protein